MTIHIRAVKLTDLKSWTSLWNEYLVFYQSTALPKNITDLLWKRIHTVDHPICCLVAECSKSKVIVGFVHFFNHCDTWRKNDVCYLEDLYVCAKERRNGIGESLIQAVYQYAQDMNWGKVYWHTQQHNNQARALYDKVTGGTDGFVCYRLTKD